MCAELRTRSDSSLTLHMVASLASYLMSACRDSQGEDQGQVVVRGLAVAGPDGRLKRVGALYALCVCFVAGQAADS